MFIWSFHLHNDSLPVFYHVLFGKFVSHYFKDNLKKVKAEKQELQETIDGLEKAKEDLEAELTSLSKQLTVTQDECENEKEQTGVNLIKNIIWFYVTVG